MTEKWPINSFPQDSYCCPLIRDLADPVIELLDDGNLDGVPGSEHYFRDVQTSGSVSDHTGVWGKGLELAMPKRCHCKGKSSHPFFSPCQHMFVCTVHGRGMGAADAWAERGV